MDWQGWAEIAPTLSLSVGFGWPLGIYMSRVRNGERTWLDPVLRPVERGLCAACGVGPARGQGWASDAGAFLAFNAAASVVTNTNWQSYGGETTLSHLSQMAGLTTQNFPSAAGATMAAALARAFAASRAEAPGNFWAGLIRTTLWVLLPLSFALVLAGLGVVQTIDASVTAATLEGAERTISLAPAASRLAIKQFGINGGGIFNANSAHPLGNPSILTNLLTSVAIDVLGRAASWPSAARRWPGATCGRRWSPRSSFCRPPSWASRPWGRRCRRRWRGSSTRSRTA